MAQAMTVPLSEELAAELALVAESDGMPVSRAVREAIVNHVIDRRRDTRFQMRLRQRKVLKQQVFERLAE